MSDDEYRTMRALVAAGKLPPPMPATEPPVATTPDGVRQPAETNSCSTATPPPQPVQQTGVKTATEMTDAEYRVAKELAISGRLPRAISAP